MPRKPKTKPVDLPVIPAELLEPFGSPDDGRSYQCRNAGSQEGLDQAGAGR